MPLEAGDPSAPEAVEAAAHLEAQAVVGDTDWDTCASAGCSAARVSLDDETCLAHLSPKALERALGRFSRGRPLDARGVTFDAELFGRLLGAAPAEDGRRRLSTLRLDFATFECDVRLDGALFRKDASFHGARFRAGFSFQDVRVAGQARFSQAVFDGPASFQSSRFDGPAWFAGARFGQPANFAAVVFNGPAWLFDATFAADVGFDDATFSRHTSFERAIFEGRVDFIGATFEDNARFAYARLTHPPAVDGAAFLGREGLPAFAQGRRPLWSGPPLAGWFRRVGASLIDLLTPLAVVAAGIGAYFGLRWLQDEAIGWVVLGATILGAMGWVCQNVVRQGRAGQTVGKQVLRIALIREVDRRPPGVPASIVRQPLHLFDVVPAFLGLLWPLWDRKHQTFTDKLQGTVVVLAVKRWDPGDTAKRRRETRLAAIADGCETPAVANAHATQTQRSAARSRAARSPSRQRRP